MGKITKSEHSCIHQHWVKNVSRMKYFGSFSTRHWGLGREGSPGQTQRAPLTPCPEQSGGRCRWAGTSGTWSPAHAGVCRGCCPRTTAWQWPGCPWSCSPWRAGCSRVESSWQRSTKSKSVPAPSKLLQHQWISALESQVKVWVKFATIASFLSFSLKIKSAFFAF